MKCYIGIDLGSTTTKAIVLAADETILGRGITNSRSNYSIAAEVAKREAFLDTRFFLFHRQIAGNPALSGKIDDFLANFEQDFRLEQFLEQLADLERTCLANTDRDRYGDKTDSIRSLLRDVFAKLRDEAPELFGPGSKRKSDFFRDIAGSQYLATGEAVAKEAGTRYDYLLNLFDRSIIEVENRVYADSMIERSNRFNRKS